jgi:hypothetical protein
MELSGCELVTFVNRQAGTAVIAKPNFLDRFNEVQVPTWTGRSP